MPLVPWTEELRVGVQVFDEEHQRLVRMLNELQSAIVQGSGHDTARRILAGLASYTVAHFRHEEELMARHCYPGLAAHRQEHVQLAQQIANFQSQLARGQITVTMGLLKFLKDWLTKHIRETDAHYAEFFSSRGL